MVDLTAEEHLASYVAQAVIRAKINFVQEKEILWRIMKRCMTFKLQHAYEDQDLVEESLFRDYEANHAKREMHFHRRKAKYEARILSAKRVELDVVVAQLNTFLQRDE
jgi:hypothetical protein